MTTLLTVPTLLIITKFIAHAVAAMHLVGHLVK